MVIYGLKMILKFPNGKFTRTGESMNGMCVFIFWDKFMKKEMFAISNMFCTTGFSGEDAQTGWGVLGQSAQIGLGDLHEGRSLLHR